MIVSEVGVMCPRFFLLVFNELMRYTFMPYFYLVDFSSAYGYQLSLLYKLYDAVLAF